MPRLTLPFGDGLDRYSGIAVVRPGAMADLRNVRPFGGKVKARGGTELRGTVPDQDDFSLIKNGGFDTDTEWTKGTNWQIAAGVASQTAPSASDLSQPVQIVPGESYEVTVVIAGRTAGSIAPKLGGTSGTARSTNGTFVETIVAGSSDSLLAFSADGTWDGNLDDADIWFEAANPVGSVPLIHEVQSQQEGVVAAYYPASRQVHVYRIGATGTDPIHVGLWFTLDPDASEPPTFIAAESYAKAFLAHTESRVGKRATTQVYDAIAGSISDLEADLRGSGDEPVKFRAVLPWRNYLVGWGFGDASDVRPEIVRISLPGQPDVFNPEHYFIAGDRGSAVTEVKPAGPGLVVCKPAQSFQIVGESELNFGILPLYSLQGCVAPRLAITVRGRCYSWGVKGPWVTTVSDENDLEPPLELEGPEPSDLEAITDTRSGFAVYVPLEDVIEWHFGSRIFALSLEEEDTDGLKWSYRERPFSAAGGGLLYSGGEVLADSPDVAPTGHAEIDTIDPADGTTATLNWDNVAQDGDETLEVWLRPDGGAWVQVVPNGIYGGALVSNDLDVSLAASQSLDLDSIVIAKDYDVAIRYRRGSQYQDAYSSADPEDWPATSRATFHTTPVAPTLDAVVWARTSASMERMRVSFTPATDHETVSHKVLRGGVPIATLDPGVTTYDDFGMAGEATTSYTVQATANGHDSVDSNAVATWAGPFPPTNVQDDGGTGGVCGGGQLAYAITWTNTVLGSISGSELFKDGAPFQEFGPLDEAAGPECSATGDFAVRHFLTQFGVRDYSELIGT